MTHKANLKQALKAKERLQYDAKEEDEQLEHRINTLEANQSKLQTQILILQNQLNAFKLRFKIDLKASLSDISGIPEEHQATNKNSFIAFPDPSASEPVAPSPADK